MAAAFPSNVRFLGAVAVRERQKTVDSCLARMNLVLSLVPPVNNFGFTLQLVLTIICHFPFQARNDVVIWDKIIRRKEDANLSIAGRNKYAFRELSSSFKYVLCPLLFRCVYLLDLCDLVGHISLHTSYLCLERRSRGLFSQGSVRGRPLTRVQGGNGSAWMHVCPLRAVHIPLPSTSFSLTAFFLDFYALPNPHRSLSDLGSNISDFELAMFACDCTIVVVSRLSFVWLFSPMMFLDSFRFGIVGHAHNHH